MSELGFGMLRLPTNGDELDLPLICEMTDTFLNAGGKYFDTAWFYVKGKSEEAVRLALSERYPREKFMLADKLPVSMLKSADECETYFAEQCRRCGVEWFDVYLLQWLNGEHYRKAKELGAFEFLSKLKADGKAKRIGFSYHGDAATLEKILTEHPEVDLVQLQINYLDWKSPVIQSRRCYETARKFGKTVTVMEPVKGGTLASLPQDAAKLLPPGETSPAVWALRFAASWEGVEIVLSGMNTAEQLRDNLQPLTPLSEDEKKALFAVAKELSSKIAVPCTGCGYCAHGCPQFIAIPDYFRLYNEACRYPQEVWKIKPLYRELTKDWGKASYCMHCGACECNCPQHITVTKWLLRVVNVFEN